MNGFLFSGLAGLATLSIEDFVNARRLDEPMGAWLARTQIAHGAPRHVGSLDRRGRAHAGLAILPSNHPVARMRLTDNVVQFRTQRYRDNPLLVQEPGAGPEVATAGVFADMLGIAAMLAVPS